MAREHAAQIGGTGLVERGAGRVLRARRDDAGVRPAPEGALHLVGERAVLVDAHRLDGEAERRREVEHGGEPGILHRDPISGTEMRLQCALDAVEGAADDAERGGRDVLGGELLGGDREQLRIGAAQLGVQARPAVEPRERAAEARQERRIGVPDREVAHVWRQRRRRARRDRRPRADAGAAAAARDEQPAATERVIRGHDRRGADPQAGGERPHRRQRRADRQPLLANGVLDARGNGACSAPADLILYYHV